MIRESPLRSIPCPRCNGIGKTRINWVDADLHERTKMVTCKRCMGKRQIEIAICAQIKD